MLLAGTKRMITRGAVGRKLPHGRVQPGDWLYFSQNHGEGLVRARAQVPWIFCSEKLSEAESQRVIEEHQPELQLTPAQVKRCAGKRYLVLVQVNDGTPIPPFAVDRSGYGNMDDWRLVGNIEQARFQSPSGSGI